MYEFLVQMMLMKHSPPPHITDQNVNKVGAANAPFIFSPQYIWKYDILRALPGLSKLF